VGESREIASWIACSSSRRDAETLGISTKRSASSYLPSPAASRASNEGRRRLRVRRRTSMLAFTAMRYTQLEKRDSKRNSRILRKRIPNVSWEASNASEGFPVIRKHTL
jgi:hypothetical protein